MFEWIKTFIAVYETKILVRRQTIVYFSANCFFANQEIRATLFDQAVLS